MNKVVDFSTAKLLKEKGFDKKVRSMYCEDKLLSDTNARGNYNDVTWVRTWRSSRIDDTLSAPTIAEVIDWLYEKHGIWIDISLNQFSKPKDLQWMYSIVFTQDCTYSHSPKSYNSPTEAYESAIKYCLEKII